MGIHPFHFQEILDLNSSELFNKHYQSQNQPSFEISLLHFFTNDVSSRLNYSSETKLTFLDIGCGSQSIFEHLDIRNAHVLGLDFSSHAIALAKRTSQLSVTYENLDITKHSFSENTFDFIFDSHCLHCIVEAKDREFVWKSLYNSLKPSGLLASEMMIQPTKKQVSFPHKHIPSSLELEREILSYGFKIKFLYVEFGRTFSHGGEECDLVKIILEK